MNTTAPAFPVLPPSVRFKVEAGVISALIAVVILGAALGWGTGTLRYAVLAVLLGSAAYTDARYGLLPNRITALAVLLGLGLALAGGNALGALAAGAVAAGILLLVRWAGRVWKGRPGMGLGDVKLAFALGLLAGWAGLWALYLAAVGAAGFGIIRRRRTGAATLPFAPWIGVGTALALTVLPFERVWSWFA